MMKAVTCSGNTFQIVFDLNARIDENLLRKHLHSLARDIPMLQGKMARDINLAPYWRMPPAPDSLPPVSLAVHDLDGNALFEHAVPILEECVNRPFGSKNEHLRLHLIHIDAQRDVIAMAFDHKLLDARGGEAFIQLLNDRITGRGSEMADDIPVTGGAFLSDWAEKFRSGRNVNRKVRALTRPAPESLPIPSGRNRGFRFKIISFGTDETEAIYTAAYNEAGYLMEMPFLLSVAVHAMHTVFAGRGMKKPDYLIPVTVDMRTGKDIKKELFFNHVSYLFFRIRAGDMTDRKVLIQSIKGQMYDQIKSGLPQDIYNASHLTRIAPLALYRALFRIPFKGEIASFCFAHLGKTLYNSVDFMNAGIENCIHMPRVPVPPGIGFFFNRFRNRLNLVVTYLDGILEDDELTKIETATRNELGVYCNDGRNPL
jgi:NRPS condensation-like uncharacterized protein